MGMMAFTQAPEIPEENRDAGENMYTDTGARSHVANFLKRVEYYDDAIQEWAKEIAHVYGDSMKKTVAKAYEAPPTKLDINFQFASPIVQVPVQGVGMSVFTLGKLEITTPKPCPYKDLAMKVILSKAQLRSEALM